MVGVVKCSTLVWLGHLERMDEGYRKVGYMCMCKWMTLIKWKNNLIEYLRERKGGRVSKDEVYG